LLVGLQHIIVSFGDLLCAEVIVIFLLIWDVELDLLWVDSAFLILVINFQIGLVGVVLYAFGPLFFSLLDFG
jgi:hypothetical protein